MKQRVHSFWQYCYTNSPLYPYIVLKAQRKWSQILKIFFCPKKSFVLYASSTFGFKKNRILPCLSCSLSPSTAKTFDLNWYFIFGKKTGLRRAWTCLHSHFQYNVLKFVKTLTVPLWFVAGRLKRFSNSVFQSQMDFRSVIRSSFSFLSLGWDFCWTQFLYLVPELFRIISTHRVDLQ